MANIITAERLREILNYDPETGVFRYRVRRGICFPGDMAGSHTVRGNWSIGINYRRYSAHRLAWLYMTDEWPDGEIDHIDGDALNNKWSNLRLVTGAQNKQNFHRPRIDNKSGFLGVYFHGHNAKGKPRWRARIQLDGKITHLGLFDSPELAHEAYIQAKRQLHPFGML